MKERKEKRYHKHYRAIRYKKRMEKEQRKSVQSARNNGKKNKRKNIKKENVLQDRNTGRSNTKSMKLTFSRVIPFVIAVAWLGVLVFLSSQNGESTAATSLPMAEWLQQYIFTSMDVGTVHMMIRRDAHFIVFFIESLLFLTAVYNVWGKLWRSVGTATVLCVSLAYIDEAHKVLIPGRHCQWNEAGMNAIGALLGIGIFLIIYFVVWGVKKVIRH